MSDVQMTLGQQLYLGMAVTSALAFLVAVAWGSWQSRRR